MVREALLFAVALGLGLGLGLGAQSASAAIITENQSFQASFDFSAESSFFPSSQADIFFEFGTITGTSDLTFRFFDSADVETGMSSSSGLDSSIGAVLRAIGFNPALTDPIGTVVLSLENATAGASVDITDSSLRFVDATNIFNQTSFQTLTFTEVPSAVIPLPATAWMVIGGLGLGALVARRRHGGADVVRSLRRERQQTPE